MKRNAAKITITISNGGIISLSLDNEYSSAYTTEQYMEHITKYIECFNKLQVLTPKSFGSEQSCRAYITYYSLTDLFSNNKGLYILSDSDMKDCAVMSDEVKRSIFDAPTLHMTLGNIFEEKDENDNLKEPYKRFARFMDSSIWNFYAPIIVKDESIKDDGLNPDRYNFSYFKSAILAIINNSCYKFQIKVNDTLQDKVSNLYELNVTKEYADINQRIFMQSKLMEISGHGKNVSPFLFHSEQKVKSAIKEKEQQKNEILSYKWRILLVDDHAEIPMRIGEKSSTIAKLDIIKKAFIELFGAGNVTTDIKDSTAKIYIDCANTIEEAQNKLKEKKYEIILLDYLLGEKGAGREYGYELLKGIWYKENEKKFEKVRKEELEKLYKEFVFDYKKGPDYRFYFMFISAFTTAVSERLLTQGWARNEDYWYIGEGACPINTPYLFQYRLLHIMEKRMKKMGIFILSKTANDDFKASKIYEDVIAKIFPEDKDKNKGGKIRKYANDKFQDVLSLLYHYKNLLVDTQITANIFETKGSVLATDFVKKNPNLGGLLEHLTQLVYLTAFGTVRQWPEMWEEYQFIKSIIGQPIGAIEEYIVNLKINDLQ